LEKLFRGEKEERKEILNSKSTTIELKFLIDDYITRI